MISIPAIIIDDEAPNRSALKYLIETYCPNIVIIGEANNAIDAFNIVNKLKPKLIFLDIMMPNYNGFDFLKLFKIIHFDIIFVTSYNEYAVSAFEFNAIGYVLKPIDHTKLINAVNKAVLKITLDEKNDNLDIFIKSFDPEKKSNFKIAIHQNEKVIFLNILNIISIETTGNVSTIIMNDNKRHYSSKDLKLFDNALKVTKKFIRINNSVLINVDFIKNYSKGQFCIINMENGKSYEVSRRKKTEVLNLIRILKLC